MVSSVCRGSYPSMTPHASPSRKPHIDLQKDYTTPLQVETSVEYDLPAHIYPPKGSQPILMIHPSYLSAVRARSRAVVTPSPAAMVASSGVARPLAPLHPPQQQAAVRRSWCTCGNPNCNSSSVKSVNVQSVRNTQNAQVQSVVTRSVQNPISKSVQNLSVSRSVQSQSVSRSVTQSATRSVQSAREGSMVGISRSVAVMQQQPQQAPQQQQQQVPQQQFVWGNGGRCTGPCCNPKAAAIAPTAAEFVAPGLPPSLLARTPTRGTAGGSPKLRAARTRRGLSVASSVNLPDYLGSSRPARLTGGAVHLHPRPRALSTSMGALAATPAPPMAHQHMAVGASLTPSLDSIRTEPLTPRSVLPLQQQQPLQQAPTSTTTTLFNTVGLSRDSGCSVGTEVAGGDWAGDRTRGLDSGFCTPVDLTEEFVTDTLNLSSGSSWQETQLPSSVSSGGLPTSSLPSTSSLLPAAPHHYLPQPLWNLAY